MLDSDLATSLQSDDGGLRLDDGSCVAVIGGGPAGSFFAYFLLDMAARLGIDVSVDVYEARDFSCPAPKGCNMCGGIISESLVQALATEGINLPPTLIQRGIDSYTLHTDMGSVRIETPLHEMRIGAVYRGPGPRDIKNPTWESFDAHLQKLSCDKGAKIVNARVDDIDWDDGRPRLKTRGGDAKSYDLLAVAAGVNTATLKMFESAAAGYAPPVTTKTVIREYLLGRETISECMGSSMHVFLLNIPRLEFAAIIPKGDYVSVCLLGDEIDKALVDAFLNAPEVKRCFPAGWEPDQESCKCQPRISLTAAARPFADRLVFIGDCGVTRLYKDGIGAAYRTSKAAAAAAVFQGISAADFERHYWPACKGVKNDNTIGKLVFGVTRQIQKYGFARRAVVRMTAREQERNAPQRPMSMVLWDMFTGSAPYKEIFLRTLNPAFLGRFSLDLLASTLPGSQAAGKKEPGT